MRFHLWGYAALSLSLKIYTVRNSDGNYDNYDGDRALAILAFGLLFYFIAAFYGQGSHAVVSRRHNTALQL